MSLYREQRGTCLIVAGAAESQDGGPWKPWITLTRRRGKACSRDTFDKLKPLFATEQAALRYAADLGRSLADEGWASESPSVTTAAATSFAADIRAIGSLCANGMRKALHDAGTMLTR